MNTVNTVAMAPGGFGDGKEPPATSLGSQQVPFALQFRHSISPFLIPHPVFPIPHSISPFLIPHPVFPIPHSISPFPIPHSPFHITIPHSLFPIPHSISSFPIPYPIPHSSSRVPCSQFPIPYPHFLFPSCHSWFYWDPRSEEPVMNTVNTVAMAPGGFGDGKKPQPLPWAANKYLCTLIFAGFGVCGFRRLAAIRKRLVHKNLDISV